MNARHDWIGKTFGLEGNVAVITGAAGGIGRACALAMSRAGADVVLADLDPARPLAAKIIGDIEKEGGRAAFTPINVADEASVSNAIAFAVSAFGGLDILVNSAAAVNLLPEDDEVITMPTELWDEVMAVNVRGTMLGCKYAVPIMLERKGGVIINVSSAMSARAGERNVAYATSKAAVDNLTRSVAARYGRRGIRCNAICPGTTPHANLPNQTASKPVFDIHARHTLLPSLCKPEDQAATAVFLASPASAGITGQVISVDGGLNAHLPTWADMRDFMGME